MSQIFDKSAPLNDENQQQYQGKPLTQYRVNRTIAIR